MNPGCLIVNLGSPEALTNSAIRRFLSRFLSDRRVVDFHPAAWQPILRGIVLPFRPSRIRHQYEHVWMPEGSPLTVHTAVQRDQLAAHLPGVDVRYAMTYTAPTIAAELARFESHGIDDVTILPLYPQYAPSTVAPIADQVMAFYRKRPQMPTLRIIRSWQTSPTFISWHANAIRQALADEDVDRIVFSYHSVPDRAIHSPEPYRAECTETTRAIMDLVGDVPFEETYQSVFGPGAWIGPATIDRMALLPAEGASRILVVTPGFFADCIETSFELDVQNQEVFTEAGGRSYRRVSPPNSDPAVGEMLAEVYRAHAPAVL